MKARPLKPAFCARAKSRADFVKALTKYLEGEPVHVESLAAAGERFQLACTTGKFKAVKKAQKALPALCKLAVSKSADSQKDRAKVRKSWLAELARFTPVERGKMERTCNPPPSEFVTLGKAGDSPTKPNGCLAAMALLAATVLLGSLRLLTL